jgi:hypothetical protein
MKWYATAVVISSGAESRETVKATKLKKKRLEDWERFYGYGGSQKKIRVVVRSRTRAVP